MPHWKTNKCIVQDYWSRYNLSTSRTSASGSDESLQVESFAKNDMRSCVKMISLVIHWWICSRKVRSLQSVSSSTLQLQWEQDKRIVHIRSDHNQEFENGTFKMSYASPKTSFMISLPLWRLSKMGSLSERIECCNRWLEWCYMLKLFLFTFG